MNIEFYYSFLTFFKINFKVEKNNESQRDFYVVLYDFSSATVSLFSNKDKNIICSMVINICRLKRVN